MMLYENNSPDFRRPHDLIGGGSSVNQIQTQTQLITTTITAIRCGRGRGRGRGKSDMIRSD